MSKNHKYFPTAPTMVTLKGDKYLSESKGALFFLLEASFSFQIMVWVTDLNCQTIDWFLFNGNIGLKWVKPVTKTCPIKNKKKEKKTSLSAYCLLLE